MLSINSTKNHKANRRFGWGLLGIAALETQAEVENQCDPRGRRDSTCRQKRGFHRDDESRSERAVTGVGRRAYARPHPTVVSWSAR